MDILQYKDYEGTAELDMARGVCRGKILFISDLVTYESDTIAGLQKEFELAVDDYIETCALVGKEPLRPFKGLFNVRVSPELHRAAALRATKDGVSLNEVVSRSIDCYVNGPAGVVNHIQVTIEQNKDVQSVRSVASQPPKWEGVKSAQVH